MSGKKTKDSDFEDDEMNDEILDDSTQIIGSVDDSEDDIVDIVVDDDDETFHDDVIEIDETDLELDTPEAESEVVLSKHTLQGKHSLKYDSIFKGKKEDPLTEDEVEFFGNSNETFEVDKSSHYWYESIDNENYIKEKRIKEKVYEVLNEHTDINFLNNRRKPSKSDFNHYYYLLKTHLNSESFTNVELFNELAVYFSDNLFNMFKLLDNKWRNLIILELQDHIGKQNYSNEVRNRNIYEGTEVEFLEEDPTGIKQELVHITGVVIEADYENSIFKINSYERIYEVELLNITKILNNTKFKYNLNKLNNIDFL